MSAIAELSMTDLAGAIARGEVTALAAAEACIARIDAKDKALNAFIRLDRAEALEAARAADRKRASGATLGPLHGVPMAHKDMYYREGRVSTCGSKIRRDFVPKVTATVLDRLDAAGAIDLGTLNMAEFAQNPTGHNAHFGDAHNPWNPPYCTGGSSSGSGVAVASRMVYAALGSDTGGSIRLPATICGVTGIKGTQTRVSRAGVMPLSFSMDNVGPLTRTARDAARFMAVIAGQDPKDPTSAPEPVPDYEAALTGDIRGLRIAVPQEWFFDGADDVVVTAFEAALDVLKARGAVVERISAPSLGPVCTAVAVVSRVEGATIHANWMRERAGDYAVHLSARLFGGYALPANYYLEALSLRGPLLRRFCAEALGGYDIVATPTLRTRVPTLAETDVDADPANWQRFMAVSANTRPFNYLGLPTVSVPCGFDDRGLPIGLQLAGRPFAEGRVLQVADAYQRETDWHARVPG
ncbi:amidase [Plastoroseomonas hellenica]|uniref:amidase n=1 Tax=Plastoroseomonas hellenica TaxID=2687306 RepID=UPI001BAB0AE8|nr:amidase [Plastoroseomonas hellenica]MBR0647151.1 Asp-tRNA(Asn)/Glu-tRNA(Gln) amidotransferase subunit GatA [Plastoroseomonas hellenica]